MKLLGLILLVLLVGGLAYAYVGHKRQRSRDLRLLDRIRADAGTIALQATILEEGVSQEDRSTVLRTRTIDDGELLLGKGYLLPVYLMAAIHNPAVLPSGVKEITWSIPIDEWEAKGDSLTVTCTLPHDERTFTRLTFAGLLAEGRREAVMSVLRFSQ